METRPFNITPHWQDGSLYHTRYGDRYHSKYDFHLEARSVFIEPSKLPEDFKKSSLLVEVGFGCGLHLFHVYEEWKKGPQLPFTYLGLEEEPFSCESLLEIHKRLGIAFPSDFYEGYQKKCANRLVIRLGNFIIHIAVGDATELLRDFPKMAVDVWFLDGFSPQKNPSAWSFELIEQMVRHSVSKKSIVVSYSVASSVRELLLKCGFRVEKKQSVGLKKERLWALYQGDQCVDSLEEWPMAERISAPVAIVGGGLAGSALAYALTKEGVQVELFESNDQLALGSSGNDAALFMRSLERGFSYARELQNEGLSLLLEAWPILADNGLRGFCQGIFSSANNISRQIVEGGWVDPKSLCQAYIRAAEKTGLLQVFFNRKITMSYFKDEKTENSYQAIIWANGIGAQKFLDDMLVSVRGEVLSFSSQDPSLRSLDRPCHFKGFLVSTSDCNYVCGATYSREEDTLKARAPRKEDQDAILKSLNEWVGKSILWDNVSSRVGFRVTTHDHLPVIGPLYKKEMFLRCFGQPLRHGSKIFPKMLKKYPSSEIWFEKKHYMVSGLGSRGILYSTVAASWLASHFSNRPIPTKPFLLRAVRSTRFLERELKLKPTQILAAGFEDVSR